MCKCIACVALPWPLPPPVYAVTGDNENICESACEKEWAIRRSSLIAYVNLETNGDRCKQPPCRCSTWSPTPLKPGLQSKPGQAQPSPSLMCGPGSRFLQAQAWPGPHNTISNAASRHGNAPQGLQRGALR
ncbi:hypothetical protein FIBSPDRAFT_871085 [Athelia psychrophila]|uniref:Uncharacterized protein n=1 Tax=Athelia psychrophila TaxID=1759441 RepID=A0A166AKB8_9AGAM|nr:hypothetical protein FIBSPDRAFT_871085 [Fibularhizoctonia sp. CBS 109695]